LIHFYKSECVTTVDIVRTTEWREHILTTSGGSRSKIRGGQTDDGGEVWGPVSGH